MPGKTKESRSMKNHISGIYMIINKLNSKVYIGQSISVTTRWGKHKNLLKNGTHYNSHLQSTYNVSGIDVFEFTILEVCLLEQRDERERYWIKQYNSTDNKYGYNSESGGCKNKVMFEETKQRISKANIGHRGPIGFKHTEETKRKLSEQRKGISQSIEHTLKNSECHKGLKYPIRSEEHRRKLSEVNTGKIMSEETKQKIREARKNQVMKPVSEETRRKISESNKGNTNFKGMKHSEETKRKMSERMMGNANSKRK